MMRWLGALALCLLSVPASAQTGSDEGLKVVVPTGGVSIFQMAVPDALSMGGAPDTRGITEALTGTVSRALKISGYFNLIEKAAFLTDPSKEGMNPSYKDWFNIGTQGLVKMGYRIVGTKVVVDARLYSVDTGTRIDLGPDFAQPVELPLKTSKARRHALKFVNAVIKHYTKADGLFLTQIVFVKRVNRNKELFMVSPDGSGETRLTKGGGINMLPSFSGGKIYFTSFRNGGAHTFKLSGGKVTPFTSYKGLNTGPVLSPNGKSVALTLSKDGNPEIYLVDPSTGKTQKRLTNSWGIDTSVAWSPDGSQLAFVSDRHGSPQIWIMNASGGGQRRLTFNGDYNQTPDWSPRGDKIVFTARDERNVFDIFTVSVGDGKITRLTQNQGNNEEPSFSPDGRYVVFTSTRSGESKLYVSTLDGRLQTRISTGKGEYLTPAWSR